jgi:ElaB/YqjD/DUF883 family membrane-anchored ribosome-binding protein
MGEKPDEMTSPPQEDPERIRQDIHQTRAEMAETIDAIQDKLRPQHIMEQAKESVREATVGKVKDMVNSASDTASTVAGQVQETTEQAVEYVKENPLPAALIGAGVAWLIMRAQRSEPRTSYPGRNAERARTSTSMRTRDIRRHDGDWFDIVRDNPISATIAGLGIGWMLMNRRGPSARDWRDDSYTRGTRQYDVTGRYRTDVYSTRGGVGGYEMGSSESQSVEPSWTERAQDSVSDAARQAQEAVSSATSRAQERLQYYGRRTETEFERWMRENPLTVGAAAVALGAAVGLGMPRTETEDAWMGEARDTLVDRAQDVAKETVQQAQQVVDTAQEGVNQAARAVGGGRGGSSGSSSSSGSTSSRP